MIRRVEIAQQVLAKANARFGESRSPGGAPSEYDFVSGPLAAAEFAFRDFDVLPVDIVPSIRSYTIVDPAFGPIVFVGLLTSDGIVEIVEFSDDPDYWDTIRDDPS